MDGAGAQSSSLERVQVSLPELERDTLEALSEVHLRIDQLRSVRRLLSCSLSLLENRVRSLEKRIPQDTTDIDLQALD